MVRLPDFRSHHTSGSFVNQPLFDHSKSELLRITYPNFSELGKYINRKNNYVKIVPNPAAPGTIFSPVDVDIVLFWTA